MLNLPKQDWFPRLRDQLPLDLYRRNFMQKLPVIASQHWTEKRNASWVKIWFASDGQTIAVLTFEDKGNAFKTMLPCKTSRRSTAQAGICTVELS